MNTHNKIELPLLPSPTHRGYGLHYNADEMESYARTAIEADRKQRHLKEEAQLEQEWAVLRGVQAQYEADRKSRGEPVGYVMPTDMQKLRAGSHALIGPKSQGADIPLYLDPRPAEPVKAPSKLSNAEILSLAYDVGAMPEQAADANLVRFARALLAGCDHPCPHCDPIDGKYGPRVQAAWHAGWDAARDALPRITDGDIRAIMLKHGYTIKIGNDDLKPYVYAAARELIALAQGREP